MTNMQVGGDPPRIPSAYTQGTVSEQTGVKAPESAKEKEITHEWQDINDSFENGEGSDAGAIKKEDWLKLSQNGVNVDDKKKLESLQGEKKELEGQKTGIEEQNKPLAADAQKLKEKIAKRDEDIAKNKTSVDDLPKWEEKIKTCDSDISSLESQVKGEKDKTKKAELEKKLRTRQADKKKVTGELEQKRRNRASMNDQQMFKEMDSRDLGKIEANIKKNEATIAGINKRLEQVNADIKALAEKKAEKPADKPANEVKPSRNEDGPEGCSVDSRPPAGTAASPKAEATETPKPVSPAELEKHKGTPASVDGKLFGVSGGKCVSATGNVMDFQALTPDIATKQMNDSVDFFMTTKPESLPENVRESFTKTQNYLKTKLGEVMKEVTGKPELQNDGEMFKRLTEKILADVDPNNPPDKALGAIEKYAYQYQDAMARANGAPFSHQSLKPEEINTVIGNYFTPQVIIGAKANPQAKEMMTKVLTNIMSLPQTPPETKTKIQGILTQLK